MAAAALGRSATPMGCPDPANENLVPCYGGAGNTSYFGSGMVDALGAASR